ncbi:MAG TPA: ABC transporter substrate-binding protein, partial [Clostridia bacterium]|nr:ABC transporter substrate-binding protein [Clostridia bacterium]
MVKTKSKILIGIMALILIVTITACNSSEVGSGNNDKEIIAIDAIDREVKRPESMDRLSVTCQGGATHQLSILGASENIVAQTSMAGFPQLLKMYPRYKEVLDPGSFDEVNVEELLKVETDMAFVGIISIKGNELIEDAGIPTFTMFIGSAEIDTARKEFENVGKILGNEKRANELIEYWDEKLEMVEKLVDKVPQDERKKVYYAGEEITSASSGKWGHSLIVGSGGI